MKPPLPVANERDPHIKNTLKSTGTIRPSRRPDHSTSTDFTKNELKSLGFNVRGVVNIISRY